MYCTSQLSRCSTVEYIKTSCQEIASFILSVLFQSQHNHLNGRVVGALFLVFSCFGGILVVLGLALYNFSNLLCRILPAIFALIAIRRIRSNRNSAPWFSQFSRTQVILGTTLFPLVFYVAAGLIVAASFGAGYYNDTYVASEKLFSSLGENMEKTNFTDVLEGLHNEVNNHTRMEVALNKTAVRQPKDSEVFDPIIADMMAEKVLNAFEISFKDIEPYRERFRLKPFVIVIVSILASSVKVALTWAFGRRIRKHWRRERRIVLEDSIWLFSFH